jgi:hypothetical protein
MKIEVLTEMTVIYTWRIYRAQGWLRAFVGTVMAETEQSAIQKGIREFQITKS